MEKHFHIHTYGRSGVTVKGSQGTHVSSCVKIIIMLPFWQPKGCGKAFKSLFPLLSHSDFLSWPLTAYSDAQYPLVGGSDTEVFNIHVT